MRLRISGLAIPMGTRTFTRPARPTPRTGADGARDSAALLRTTIGLVVLACVLLRASGVSRPLLGNFSTKGAAYGMIARVLDACKRGGIREPFLDTVPLGQK